MCPGPNGAPGPTGPAGAEPPLQLRHRGRDLPARQHRQPPIEQHLDRLERRQALEISHAGSGGWQRFREPNVRQHEGVFDPASLGFSPAVTALFGGVKYFPHFDFDLFTDVGDQLAATTTHSIYSLQPTYTRIAGSHSVSASLS